MGPVPESHQVQHVLPFPLVTLLHFLHIIHQVRPQMEADQLHEGFLHHIYRVPNLGHLFQEVSKLGEGQPRERVVFHRIANVDRVDVVVSEIMLV